MGSFPITPRFDSLGWYIIKIVNRQPTYYKISIFFFKNIFTINYIFFKFNFFKKFFFKKNINVTPLSKQQTQLKQLPTIYNFGKNILSLYHCLFVSDKNIIFIGARNNINYLPISNKSFSSRSPQKLLKLLRFYNVGCIVYFNFKKSKYLYKILSKSKTINVVFGNTSKNSKVDFIMQIYNNPLQEYMVYLVILQLYLKLKNNLKN